MTTAAKKSVRSDSDSADAVKLLTDDHKDVHGLFLSYRKMCDAKASAEDRQRVAEQICEMLTVHATIEEEIFYPAARDAAVDSSLLDEAEVEHGSAKELIAQLQSMSADEDLYDAKVIVLGEYIDHHVKEEQNELFPACKKKKMDLPGLGRELRERKSELMLEMTGEPS